MTAAAFSGDGTVLAVAAENVITLWNPDKNILLSVLGATLTVKKLLSFLLQSWNLFHKDQSLNLSIYYSLSRSSVLLESLSSLLLHPIFQDLNYLFGIHQSYLYHGHMDYA